jgi:hypothetical protein
MADLADERLGSRLERRVRRGFATPQFNRLSRSGRIADYGRSLDARGFVGLGTLSWIE